MPRHCLGCNAALRSDDWVVYMSRRVSEGDDIDRFELALDGYAHPDCHPVAYGREYRCRDEGLLHNFEGITATN